MRRARFTATAELGSGKLELQGETEDVVRAGITRMEPLVDPGAWTITDRETKHDGTTEEGRQDHAAEAQDPEAGGHRSDVGHAPGSPGGAGPF